MIALLPWLKSPNLWAIVAIVALCVGIFNAGGRYNEAKHEKAAVETNKVIVEARGKDEAEIAAADKTGAETLETVKANLKQTFIVDGDTAVWINLVK